MLFNELLYHSEKEEGRDRTQASMDEFHCGLADCQLIDIGCNMLSAG